MEAETKRTRHELDIEEAVAISPVSPSPSETLKQSHSTSGHLGGVFGRWNTWIENLAGFEARGLARVPDDQRQAPSIIGLVQMLFLWFSANITINNLAVGLTGPLVYGLGFTDCCICAVFGVFLGSLTTAYMSIWGAASGNRTMVVTRYFMGYYPSKIVTLLNIILMEGYSTIDCIVGGQVLSAVSGGGMSVVVGIVIVAIIQCVIAAFGLKIFHLYERFAWLPQLVVLLVLAGVAGRHFNTSLTSSATGKELAAARLSFFSLMFYIPNSWAGAGSDYYVYYPHDTPKWKIFWLTFAGLALSFWFVDILGIGLGCGVTALPAWESAYEISSGALITAGYAPLHTFGKFCAVVIALGVIANCVPAAYSAAIGCQIMGRWGQLLPRYVWVIIMVVIQLVCGVAGRNHLFIIFTNFLALMSYWLMFMICIIVEEQVIFKPRLPKINWAAWSDSSQMPVGLAALAAFLVGWVGAVLGMYQIYFTGPLAAASGGADVGMWVGCGFTLVTFPPLRWLEVKKFGR